MAGSRSRAFLLYCGLLAAVVYLLADIVASIRYDGYSWLDQAVSELFAIDAPTRPLILVLFSIHNMLLAAFGLGVWRSAGERRGLRVAACLLVASAVLGAVTDFFFPIHQRGVPGGTTDTMHAAATAVQVLFTFVMVGCAARAFSRGFAIFSGAVVVFLLAGGVVTGLAGGNLAENEPTPWMGATERMLIYAYLSWIAVLAVMLLRRDARSVSPEAP